MRTKDISEQLQTPLRMDYAIRSIWNADELRKVQLIGPDGLIRELADNQPLITEPCWPACSGQRSYCCWLREQVFQLEQGPAETVYKAMAGHIGQQE